MFHLGEIIEDLKAALGYGNVHCVFGADVDGCPRFRKNYKVVSVNWTLVLDWVGLHLQKQKTETNNLGEFTGLINIFFLN